MSIADLKMRLADVPGIETLSMALEGRQFECAEVIQFGFGRVFNAS
jgi:hypothetical protein